MAELAIAIRDLQFRWRQQDAPLLDIPALEVRRGERLFLRGPSGCGKSTLLGLLGGVSLPQQGSLQVLGCELTRLRASARDRFRADHIGFVFQQFNLLPFLSLLDNVTLACRFSPRRRAQLAAQGRTAADEALRLLQQLDLADPRLLASPVSELSVGQQQRVAVARALIGAPELLIADEPTSALDAERREAFLRLLEAECQAQGITLLFVSHDASLAPLFDRSIELGAINRAGA